LRRSPQHVRELLLAATWDLVLWELEVGRGTDAT
jgi:hypothetical protein